MLANDPKILEQKRLRARLGVNQDNLFADTEVQTKEQQKEQAKIQKRLEVLEKEIEEVKSNWIFENAFEWRFEFPEVLDDNGDFIGFDVIVGNPPYGVNFLPSEKAYFKNTYKTIIGKYESYGFFLEKGLNLLSDNGGLAYITPHTWLTVTEAKSLRSWILDKSRILEVDKMPEEVFEDATVNTVVAFLQKSEDLHLKNKNHIKSHSFDESRGSSLISLDSSKVRVFQHSDWLESLTFNIYITSDEQEFIARLKESRAFSMLNKLCDFSVGIQAYDSHVGQGRSIIESRAYHADYQKDATFVRELNGKDVSRYNYEWPGTQWVSYGEWLAHPRKPYFFQGQRILVREITGLGRHSIHATLVEDEFVNYKSILNVILKEGSKQLGYHTSYVLGILNSSLISWYFPRIANKLVTKTFPRISLFDIKQLPIRTINFSDPADKQKHDAVVGLVETMLSLHEQKAVADPSERARLEGEIAAADAQIDALVYGLYELTGEEIRIVEEAVAR